jgi:heat shock protein HslJ
VGILAATVGVVLAVALVGLMMISRSNSPSLAGTHWVLVEWNDPTPIVDPTVMTLEFSDQQYSGFTGINGFGGPYTDVKGVLTLGPAAMTLVAGPPAVMASETAYVQLLSGVTSYAIDTDRLVLTSGAVELRFRAT